MPNLTILFPIPGVDGVENCKLFYWSFIKQRKKKWQQMAKQEFDKLAMKMNWYFIANTVSYRQDCCSWCRHLNTNNIFLGAHDIALGLHFTWAMTLHSSPWITGSLPSNHNLDLAGIISKYHHTYQDNCPLSTEPELNSQFHYSLLPQISGSAIKTIHQ